MLLKIHQCRTCSQTKVDKSAAGPSKQLFVNQQFCYYPTLLATFEEYPEHRIIPMSKRTLYLMRHAKSDWSTAAASDFERPLNQRGVRAALRMGEHLEQSQAAIDLILASTAVRALQTLELMQKSWKRLSPLIVCRKGLYLATPAAIFQEISQVGVEYANLLVLGHNPGLEDAAKRLSGKAIEFPTACLAEFRVQSDSWKQAVQNEDWNLVEVIRPRDWD